MKRIGLFGGSFDPVHMGHVELAKKVLKDVNLDELWFIPAFDQPFKDNHAESFKNRSKLLKIAIEPYRKLKVCEIEASLSTPSYTYNTVKKIQKLNPGNNYFWIIGDDQLSSLDKWYRIDDLLEMIQFIVVNRNDIEVDSKFIYVDFNHPASSSEVRSGNFNYLTKAVAEKIYQEQLYFPVILTNNLSEKRSLHVLRCLDVAFEIGAYYNVNNTDLYKAVILHDITKELSKDRELAIMKKYYPQHLNKNPKIYHQYTAGYIAKQKFRINNQKIIKAISSHTTGDDRSLLGMLTYVADKLERGRHYEVERYIKICKRNLYKGFLEVLKDAEKARSLKEYE